MGTFKLGPAGAALGTTISQAISVLVSVIVIIKRKSVVLSKKDFKPYREVMGKILYIGIPIAVQDGLIQVAFIVITIIANQRGLNDAAAVGIVEKIISFLFLVPSSMLSTVSALGAQNIGANKPERAICNTEVCCVDCSWIRNIGNYYNSIYRRINRSFIYRWKYISWSRCDKAWQSVFARLYF